MNHLKPFLSLVLAWGIYGQLFSQQVQLGTVYNVKKEPLSGVSVSQGNNNPFYGILSDFDGEFAIRIKENGEKSIKLISLGYVTVVLSDIDTISHPLKIVMQEEPLTPFDNPQGYMPRKDNHFGFFASMAAEGLFTDFSEFESTLGRYNTDYMSGMSGALNFEFAVTHKRFMAGTGIGFSLSDNLDNDSLKCAFNTFQYNLDFGFKVLNSNRLVITPLIGLKWKRYRIINSDINRKIPLETYLSDKDLDMRFNQTYTSAALRIEYKPKKQDIEGYWSVGVDGGYILPLNKVPWTYSRKNRLLTDKELRIDNFFFRLFIAINIE